MLEEKYMLFCLELAASALGKVAPNPMVGAALVYNDQIISKGIHEFYGGPHAEVNALNLELVPEVLNNSHLYVTLEPCNHFGKTPPCTELIIKSGVKNVVIATRDPNPLVCGSGIKKLKENGINVTENILNTEARFLNRRFFTFHQKQRPYIILKWAETSDGFIAREDFSSKWISSEESRNLVHQWRKEEQAVLVGTRTAKFDNPELTVRHVDGRNPLRLVIDRENILPKTLNLWDDQADTICFTTKPRKAYFNEEVHLICHDQDLWEQILAELYKRNIQSLIIEGGRETLNYLIKNNLWDEARVFKSNNEFGSGIKAPEFDHEEISQVQNIATDRLFTYYNRAKVNKS
jgi:diaminohydroxyphosphoribosylaminopyrimidine deaminase / 5-amino-6-(5-phosphoribosylamino)uracil reductase